MLVAFEEAILDPPLDSVKGHWNYHHHCDQLCLGISVKRAEYFLSEQEQRSAVDDFKEEHYDLAQQHDQTPDEHLKPPNSIVDVAVGVTFLPLVVE